MTLSFPHGGVIKCLYRVAIAQNVSSAAAWLTVLIILSYLDEFSKSFKLSHCTASLLAVNQLRSIDCQWVWILTPVHSHAVGLHWPRECACVFELSGCGRACVLLLEGRRPTALDVLVGTCHDCHQPFIHSVWMYLWIPYCKSLWTKVSSKYCKCKGNVKFSLNSALTRESGPLYSFYPLLSVLLHSQSKLHFPPAPVGSHHYST